MKQDALDHSSETSTGRNRVPFLVLSISLLILAGLATKMLLSPATPGTGSTTQILPAKVTPERNPVVAAVQPEQATKNASSEASIDFQPRVRMDSGGFSLMLDLVGRWKPESTLEELRNFFEGVSQRSIQGLVNRLESEPPMDDASIVQGRFLLATLHNYAGEPGLAAEQLVVARQVVEENPALSRDMLYSLIYLQGVTELRRGENANCILCRGESSCILPISKAAQHTDPQGSRKAIEFFTEYLTAFPTDIEVGWLLNLAHMTLGEHPEKVDSRFLIPLHKFTESEFDLGVFRDVSESVGITRFNQAGGGIMEDFDGDGLLDLVTTSCDPTVSIQFLKNAGDGKFVDRTREAGLEEQTGGLNCVQADFNNDGNIDILVVRGAWVLDPMRPSLLQNMGNGTFEDVTESAGLLEPINSISAAWDDYDLDGWVDLFICCEKQPSLLYHNLRNGTFEEVSIAAGIQSPDTFACKGATWIDHDNDGYPDLFVNFLNAETPAAYYQNNHDGTFTEASKSLGIEGPTLGFSCWSWDFNNDGWMDIFATCYDRSLGDIVASLLGYPHRRQSGRLYSNQQGKGFKDVTAASGLDGIYATMGSNFGDFDNDGFLDIYLGTGEPDIATLVPNRMFKNVAGDRFADITASSRTGSLQKGHGVACGDWDRDGNIDLFVEMGGVTQGDQFHNILFQNPGHNNQWLTVKLTGVETNRAAIGARIKVVTSGPNSQTIYRKVSSGSSFGASPFQQTIGLGQAESIEEIEVTWPVSKTVQRFSDLNVNQSISITELADNYVQLPWSAIPAPMNK